jgi:diguanylate cyclase (GGDEF)-like protein
MVDIDHFKKFNDTYGHAAGDQLLRMVSSKLARMTGGGRAFRYGGEEFAVLFSEKSVEEVLPHLEAVRKNVEEGSFALRGRFRARKKPEKPRPSKGARKEVPVTISIGVAERSSTLARADAVIKAADEALYRAKKGGRNQIRT